MLDLITPDQTFSVAEFQAKARAAIAGIAARGKLAVLAGGTGLYIDSVIYNFKFQGGADLQMRRVLETKSLDELSKMAGKQGIKPDQVNFANKRHLIRAIERGSVVDEPRILRPNTLVLAKKLPDEVLKKRIAARTKRMMGQGLENEVKNLAQEYGFEAPGMQAICYSEWREYLAGHEQKIEQVIARIRQNTWQYARRQRTWFRRNRDIEWFREDQKAVQQARQFLLQ